MAAPPQSVLVEVRGPEATVTLDRAAKLNPLDWSTVKALRAAVADIEAMPAVRTVILTGAGRAFSAGGDLEGYVSLYQRPDDFRTFLHDFHAMLDGIERSRKIWLAAVNGACVAGGIELMLACDLVVAAASAKIGCGHLNFGQLPGAGGSQRLPRTIGTLRAKHLMLSGALLPAAEAERIGLVGEVVEDARLLDRARELAAAMAEKSAVGLAGMKHLVNEGMQMPIADALAFELDFVHRYATTEPDATEGLVAFAEKRKPVYAAPPGVKG
jgi:enoyl-CoA hydratase